MAQNLPLMVALALGLVWMGCMFYGMGALYRRNSPLFIIYVGSWICYALWYMRYIKDEELGGWHPAIAVIVSIAGILAVLFYAFGSEETPRKRGGGH